MADITFECPHCSQRISAADTFRGTEVQCPNCSQPFVVPNPAEPPPKRDKLTKPPSTEHPRVEQALERLRSILIAGETIEAWAVQRRLFAFTQRRVVIAATTGRLI